MHHPRSLIRGGLIPCGVKTVPANSHASKREQTVPDAKDGL